jgi:hypothetical protein
VVVGVASVVAAEVAEVVLAAAEEGRVVGY